MSDDHDKEERARVEQRGGSESARSTDLLDLVRSAEEAATVAARTRDSRPRFDPAAAQAGAAPAATEEFVDIGDDALEAPPSLPPEIPTPNAALAGERRSGVHARSSAVGPHPHARRAETPHETAWPPVMGVALIFALAVGALALVAR